MTDVTYLSARNASMKILCPQEEFAEPSDQVSLDEEPLVVHRRSAASNTLVILVHGLGGCRYGKNSTWGYFPKFLYEDKPELDVGLYEYRTLFRRAKFRESAPLPIEARIFAGILRDDLNDYKHLILIGHSMGGLLCMAAIAELLNTNQKEALKPIGGLLLMATPQTGSQRVPGLLSWFSRDFYALKPHGDFVTGIHRTFINSIVLEEGGRKPGYITIPTWAVLGASDFWVDKLSAGLGIPDLQTKTVRGSHTTVVKPQNKESGAYPFVRKCVRQVWTLIPPGRQQALNGVWEGRIDLRPYPSARIKFRLTVDKEDIKGEAVYSL
jgi:Alpha/beta hydrolase family